MNESVDQPRPERRKRAAAAPPKTPRRRMPLQAPAPAGVVRVVDANTHNLRGVDCDIPHGQLTVITGVSGSGKSSLAFDTLYAEGRRRYVESLSTYARQFLERMPRPEVEAIDNIQPAIAIEQRNAIRNARSTVGTVTEIYDYLRLLFAKVGVVHCCECEKPIEVDSPSTAAEALAALPPGTPLYVLADIDATVRNLARQGFTRFLRDSETVGVEELDLDSKAPPVVIDRVKASPQARSRLAEAVTSAFGLGRGRARVLTRDGREHIFDEAFGCKKCGTRQRKPEPNLFSFNSPLGACPECEGFGRIIGIDWDKVIPDPNATLREGAVAPWRTPGYQDWRVSMRGAARANDVPVNVPWGQLQPGHKRVIVEGTTDFPGIRGFFEWLESKRYKVHVRVLLARYRSYEPCKPCHGTRLRAEARSVRAGQKSIAQLCAMPIGKLSAWIRKLPLGDQAQLTAAPVLREALGRLDYLSEVGLDYLTLDRQARTLSGGEFQRIQLASALGATLTGTLYVLDEPSVGLHSRDSDRLVGVLNNLTARGNTVVVVEHDADIIRRADRILDLGPGAGSYGGRLVFQGDVRRLMRSTRSVTARELRRRRQNPPRPPTTRGRPTSMIRVTGARAHNLKDLTVGFPLGRLTCVTGVSGSGKSTLVCKVLYANARRMRGEAVDDIGACTQIDGLDGLSRIELIDHSPPGRSARSNPATYLGAFTQIRALLAATTCAKRLGLTAGSFSFNVSGGRCEACQGAGSVTIEMQFLADLVLPCEECAGTRFGRKALEVAYKGKNVAEILGLTVDDALYFFDDQYEIVEKLQPFADVGLGYLRLGQPTSTLSGGESQRLKLAAYLPASASSGHLFLFDEPTTGLHLADVRVLVQALQRVKQAGNTIIVIEHNIDFIREADWIIDLGPEGGDGGGQIVATGSVQDIAQNPGSITGQYLKQLTSRQRRRG